MAKTKESETRTRMARLLGEWKRGGEPATSFARRNGITAATFFLLEAGDPGSHWVRPKAMTSSLLDLISLL